MRQQVVSSCPCCGGPISGSTRLCFRCKRFVDVNRGRVLQPGEVSEQELDQLTDLVLRARQSGESTELLRRKKKMKTLLIVSIVLIVTMVLAVVGVMLLLVDLYLLLSLKSPPAECLENEELEEILTTYLVPPLLQSTFTQVEEYRHDKCLSLRAVNEAQLMQEAYNEIQGSDYVRARFRNIPVQWSDVQLFRTENNSVGFQKHKPVFHGTFLICGLGLQLPEPVTIWEREGHPDMGPGLLTGDPDFDRQFYVESRHPQTAARLLTPALIWDLKQLDLVGNGQTTLKWKEDGTLYVAIATPADLFEIPQPGERAAQLQQRFSRELGRIVQLLHILSAIQDRA